MSFLSPFVSDNPFAGFTNGFYGGSGITTNVNARSLLLENYIDSSLEFSRFQLPGVEVMAPDANGVWRPYDADEPIHDVDGSLLFGRAAGTNTIANPRNLGSVNGPIGGGGQLPTGNSTIAAFPGLTLEVLGVFVVRGVECLRIRIYGTAGAVNFALRQVPFAASTPTQTWTQSCFVAVSAGSLSGWSDIGLRLDGRNIGTVVSPNQFFASIVPTSALTRYSVTGTLNGNTLINRVTPNITFAAPSGAVIDTTFDIGWPQLTATASTLLPILPSVSAPAVSTAGQDVLTAPWSTLFPGSEWTIFGNALLDSSLGSVATILMFGSNGSGTEAWRLTRTSNNPLQSRVTTGGVNTFSAGIFSMAYDVPLSYAVSLHGGALHASAGGVTRTIPVSPGVLDTLSPMPGGRGSLSRVSILPYGIPPTNLAAALAASGV